MSHQFSSLFKKTTLALLLLLVAAWGAPFSPALAQSPISAEVDRTTIAADEQLILTVTVTGDFLSIPHPDMSAIQNFAVVSSGTSTQVSIINGEMTSQGVFIYRMQPLLEGLLVIQPVSVNIDGQVHQTQPIEIEVLPGGTEIAPPDNPAPDAENSTPVKQRDYFVEAEISNPTPYLGQQVVYTFRLYRAVNFFGRPDYRAPPFTDFWSSEILDQPHYNKEVDGKEYLVTEILTALFPANLGKLNISPAKLVIPGGLFEADITLESNPVSINVQSLPEGAPDDFSGAVGEFQIRASLSQPETTVNEPLTLLIEIEGQGNVETLTEPALPEIPDWRFFESDSSFSIKSEGGMLGGARAFERLVVPGRAGKQTFPAISFSYYNPEIETYQTVSTDPIEITVHPDDSAQGLPLMTDIDLAQQPIELLAYDIHPIKGVPFSLQTSQVISQTGWVLYWSAWILPLFVMGSAFIWKRRQVHLEENPAYARSLFARKRALNALSQARHTDEDNVTIAGRTLLDFLSDKLDAPTGGLTTDALVKVLHESGLEAQLVNRVEEILLQVDVGRFAPIAGNNDRVIISETRQLIIDLDKAFGKFR